MLLETMHNMSADVSSCFQYEQLDGLSEEKPRVLKEIKETVAHRKHLDSSIDFIGKLVFGFEKGPSIKQHEDDSKNGEKNCVLAYK